MTLVLLSPPALGRLLRFFSEEILRECFFSSVQTD